MQQLESGWGVPDGDGHHIAAVLQTATELRGYKLHHLVASRWVNGTDGEVAFQAKRSGRVTECSSRRSRGHAVLRESSFRTATGDAALARGFFLLNNPIIRRRRKKPAAASREPID